LAQSEVLELGAGNVLLLAMDSWLADAQELGDVDLSEQLDLAVDDWLADHGDE